MTEVNIHVQQNGENQRDVHDSVRKCACEHEVDGRQQQGCSSHKQEEVDGVAALDNVSADVQLDRKLSDTYLFKVTLDPVLSPTPPPSSSPVYFEIVMMEIMMNPTS